MHLNRLGYQLLELDKVDEAIDIFAANVQLFPDNANVYDSLGEAYYRKGDKEKAVESYRKALELDPEFPSALEMLRKLEE
ncbi:MAG: tetratricopeptide repeat protein, partial [Saprospiraceae bacterium]|nr:tetratricopeptide repeat protein [Saprospiraceae bacterium]